MPSDERPTITVAAMEDIMRGTVAFVDKMRELYGIKGVTLCLAMDIGQGRIAMKPLHTGVDTVEAQHMTAYHCEQLTKALREDIERQQQGKIN